MEKIINEILKHRLQEKNFFEIINNFENIIEKSKILNSPIKINEYFGKGIGKSTVITKLLNDKIIEKDWIDIFTGDIKGLYIFFTNDNYPLYVGITKNIINRIIQHIKGTTHNQATLAYNMGLINYRIDNNMEYTGTRENFDFIRYVKPMQEYLINQKIGFLNVKNDDELYILEIYCSMKYKTILNKFETH